MTLYRAESAVAQLQQVQIYLLSDRLCAQSHRRSDGLTVNCNCTTVCPLTTAREGSSVLIVVLGFTATSIPYAERLHDRYRFIAEARLVFFLRISYTNIPIVTNYYGSFCG